MATVITAPLTVALYISSKQHEEYAREYYQNKQQSLGEIK